MAAARRTHPGTEGIRPWCVRTRTGDRHARACTSWDRSRHRTPTMEWMDRSTPQHQSSRCARTRQPPPAWRDARTDCQYGSRMRVHRPEPCRTTYRSIRRRPHQQAGPDTAGRPGNSGRRPRRSQRPDDPGSSDCRLRRWGRMRTRRQPRPPSRSVRQVRAARDLEARVRDGSQSPPLVRVQHVQQQPVQAQRRVG